MRRFQVNWTYMTPPEAFITAGRAAMGGIDLVPFTCREAVPAIEPVSWFDGATLPFQDILDRAWGPHGKGRVLLMTPFLVSASRPLLDKLRSEYRAGRVKQAVVHITMAEAATKCPWIWDFPVCIPFRRPVCRMYDEECDTFRAYSPPHWGFYAFLPPGDSPDQWLEGTARFMQAFHSEGRIVVNELAGDESWQKDYVPGRTGRPRAVRT